MVPFLPTSSPATAEEEDAFWIWSRETGILHENASNVWMKCYCPIASSGLFRKALWLKSWIQSYKHWQTSFWSTVLNLYQQVALVLCQSSSWLESGHQDWGSSASVWWDSFHPQQEAERAFLFILCSFSTNNTVFSQAGFILIGREAADQSVFLLCNTVCSSVTWQSNKVGCRFVIN